MVNKKIDNEVVMTKLTVNLQTRQHGVVLIVALIFLVALTAVAAALMQNSTTDMKMAGASEIKEEAVQATISAVDEVIFNQVAPGQDNLFARPLKGNFPINDQNALLPGTNTEATAVVNVVNNDLELEVDCAHSKSASSTGVFNCSSLRVNVTRIYGRNGTSNMSASSGITQQLLK
ncbi:hypothetical protein GCM10009111_00150 [Colwellia asteriadis]|uniref:Type 4 fimbrial biogenesis protein PilX N-terminal domain-containing protein n=1 Tax=Colwellia asteriadis TaxID=517723 RepID=A0ABN1L202_9GAMM